MPFLLVVQETETQIGNIGTQLNLVGQAFRVAIEHSPAEPVKGVFLESVGNTLKITARNAKGIRIAAAG